MDLRTTADWYRDVVGFAEGVPPWLQQFAVLFTNAGVGLLYLALALSWWRARGRSARTMAFALLGPFGVVTGYLASSLGKHLVQAVRPCRALDVSTVLQCPPPDDWSFPSNHAALAASAAVGVVLAWRALAVPAVVVALCVAASRVFLGVHYPHDVLVGLLVGGGIAALTVLALVRPVTRWTHRLRAQQTVTWLLGRDVGADERATRRAEPQD